MESTDRRILLILSSGGMMACSIVLILSLLGYLSNIIALGAVNLYVIFFELGQWREEQDTEPRHTQSEAMQGQSGSTSDFEPVHHQQKIG